MTISQVSGVAQQWGDKITVSDVAEITIKHPLVAKGKELIGLQVGETLDRNTFNNLMAGAQANYVNSRGSRGALIAGDVLNTHEINRAFGALYTLGAPRFGGDEQTDVKMSAGEGQPNASGNPRQMSHYVAIMHSLAIQDARENPNVVLAWSYSDLHRLYNNEFGEWGGIRFCSSNMVPFFAGFANTGFTAVAGTAGNLPSNAGYRVIVTGSDTQNQYESQIYAVSAAVNVTGPTGSISVTTPNVPGFTYNVYIGTTTSPTNLGLTTSGPATGPLAGQAVQLPPNTTVVITGIGAAQIPPAAPAAGVTVYPTFIFGRGAYAQISLDELKITALLDADKSDPLNQLRVVGWKVYYGTMLTNQQFMMRIEGTSNFTATFG
jgi:hypothetical protein